MTNIITPQQCNITLALAGVFQAARLVDEVATTGTLSNDYYQAILGSIFKLESDSVEDVYGGKRHLTLGLRTLQELLQLDQANELMPTLRYTLSMLGLERNLAGNTKMLTTIRERIKSTQSQVDYFSLTDERVLANLASLYQDTISTFNTRIKVNGNPVHLKNPEVTNQVRALLLGGIRSAFLWHQLGGRRWRLFFSLSRMSDTITYLLKN